jgi:hypothetical protein
MVVEYVFIFCTRRDVQDGVIDRRQEAGMRVSERGQITIPKEIREQFGFGPDTRGARGSRADRTQASDPGRSNP